MKQTLGAPDHLLHGEVGDVGAGRHLELEHGLGGCGVPVEHGAVHRGESIAGDDGGLDGELLDVRLGLLQTAQSVIERFRAQHLQRTACARWTWCTHTHSRTSVGSSRCVFPLKSHQANPA